MKYYKLILERNADFQTQVNMCSDDLLKKNLYSFYQGKEISCLKLDDKANLTDVLSNGTLSFEGLIISDKFYELIKGFNLHNIQFVDIINQKMPKYKFMFFNGDLTSSIDYIKSNFRVLKSSPIKKSILNIDVPGNRDGALKVYMDVCARSIFKDLFPQEGYQFIDSFNIEAYDVFRIGYFDKSFYISEKVKNKLVDFGVTGIEYIEQPKLG